MLNFLESRRATKKKKKKKKKMPGRENIEDKQAAALKCAKFHSSRRRQDTKFTLPVEKSEEGNDILVPVIPRQFVMAGIKVMLSRRESPPCVPWGQYTAWRRGERGGE